ncbi:MAG: response regulator receiver protein [Pelosinus sp.]|jgi:YesN/AraC family two-component response regulator|nr:response regulator receiver protein [Pelosinus sp.]
MEILSEPTQSTAAVLFVDDEANILSSIRRAVIDEKYTAYFAGSGEEALGIMEKHEISVIVTDMRMPGMDGLQLLKIVKEKYPSTVKIVLSGFTQLSQVLATINQADIFNFIAKPWDMESELKYVIVKGIEHYQLKKREVQLKENLAKRNSSYQNILKKMENTSAIRENQIQHIRKINTWLLDAIERIDDNESKYLATLLHKYTDKLPGGEEEFLLSKLIETLKLLVTEDILFSASKCHIEDNFEGKVQGNYALIHFAADCLLHLAPQSHNGKNLYVQIGVKEIENKVVLSFTIIFNDIDVVYQKRLPQCSYQLAEKIFKEIMDGRFVAFRKEDTQVIQLEFVLKKDE